MEIQPDELKDQGAKLISQVLFAASHEEVKRLVSETVASVKHHNVNNETLVSFIDKVIGNLEDFTPMEKEAQQWGNIKVTRILLRRVKQNVQTQII